MCTPPPLTSITRIPFISSNKMKSVSPSRGVPCGDTRIHGRENRTSVLGPRESRHRLYTSASAPDGKRLSCSSERSGTTRLTVESPLPLRPVESVSASGCKRPDLGCYRRNRYPIASERQVCGYL